MSGLLRRIKRSRTADAGEAPADEQAAGPEDARTTAEPSPAGDDAKTTELPVTTPPAIVVDPDRPAGLDERAAATAPAGRRGRLRRRLRYLRRARELMLRDLGGLVYEVHRTGGGDFGAHSGVIAGKIERLALLDGESGAIEQALGAPRGESVVFEPGVGGTCDVCGELYASAARFCSRCGTPTDPAVRETPGPPAEAARPVPPMPKAPGTSETAVLGPAASGARAGGTAEVKATGDEPAAVTAAADREPVTAAGEPAAHAATPIAAADEPSAKTATPMAAPDEPAAHAAKPAAADDATADAAKPVAAADEPAADAGKPVAAADGPAADAAKPAATDAAKPAGAAADDEPAAPDEAKPAKRPRRAKAAAKPSEPSEPAAEEPKNPFANISNGRPDEQGEPPELSSGDPLAARESRK